MDPATLRRAAVFAVLFGGAVGATAWLSRGGSVRAPGGGDAGPGALVSPENVARVTDKMSVGESTEGTLVHDAVKVIDGKPRRYRAWTMAWARSRPRKSPDPEVGLQDVEMPHLVLYPEPDRPETAVVADGAPGTTRVTAKSGTIEYQKDVRTAARLTGDVLVQSFDPGNGEMRLATQALDCSLEGTGTKERRRAQSSVHVALDGGRVHVEGDGLDADMSGTGCRATILAHVSGRFDTPPGRLTGTGEVPGAKPLPTFVTCEGAAEIVALDPKARGGDHRWKATFHDRVRVTQGDDTLECDLLEVEFRLGPEGSAEGRVPGDVVTATGHVRIRGRTDTRDFDITCDKATRTPAGNLGIEVETVVFEGTPVMNMRGRLSSSHKPAAKDEPAPDAAKQRGRLEIRCDGPATMQTRRAGQLPTSPVRSNVTFEQNVVVRQWDDEAAPEPTGDLRAPKATLYGMRGEDGKFQPDTLTAEGGVDIKRPGITSHSGAATWTRMPQLAIDRYLLAGEPHVIWDGVRPLRAFDSARASKESKLVLDAADTVRLDVYDEREAVAGEPPRPYATVSGGPRVVMSQYADGEELTRCTADDVEATIAPGRQLQQVRASGAAHMWGRAPDGSQRDVYGTRIILDQLVLPPGAPKDAPKPALVTALGEEGTSAVALVREKDGSVHDLRADMLRYDHDAATVTALGHVVATLSAADRGENGAKSPKVAEGPVRITAGEAVVLLSPPDAKSAPRELRKVTAKGGVVIDGRTHTVTGSEAVYDAVSGMSEIKGTPARIVRRAESERYTSFVNAELIRAQFDVSDDKEKRGELVRATCPDGGLIVRYIDPPSADGKALPGTTPRRMQVQSRGPIEITRTEATATGDVRADVWSLAQSGDWTVPGPRLWCERARLTFDADAAGTANDRLRTFEAEGQGEKPVLVEADEYRCRADRVDMDVAKSKIRLSKGGGPDVLVTNATTGQRALYETATYNYVTKEWSDTKGMRVVEPTPPEKR
jgi:lipopolysaccharide export system protein LptA